MNDNNSGGIDGKGSERKKSAYEKKIDDFLKQNKNDNTYKNKVDPLTEEQKKEFLHRKLIQEPYKSPYIDYDSNENITFRALLKSGYQKARKYTLSNSFRKFRFESLPIMVFSVFSCYVGWKMQDDLDSLRRKVVVNKS